jgi:flap endonuclease-1
LLESQMKPVIILDGIPDEKKRKISPKVRDKLVVFWKLHQSSDPSIKKRLRGDKYFLFEEMKTDLRTFLSLLGVPVLVAPSEAEAQASHLVKSGQADLVFSEDYDCLLYGATRMVKSFHVTQDHANVIALPEVLKELKISHSQLIDLALLIGTDIYAGIHGIGPKKGLKLIREHGDFPSVLQALDLEIPPNLDALRGYYLYPQKISHKLFFGYPNLSTLNQYLEDKMNPDRRKIFLKRLKKALLVYHSVQKKLI